MGAPLYDNVLTDSNYEDTLRGVLTDATGIHCPERLRAAIFHAVFPGGKRIRPRLCLSVYQAYGCSYSKVVERFSIAIELLHCASLVHDDMPCFDNAALRRQLPSVHTAFGEPIALLAGDSLIVAAFGALSVATEDEPALLSSLLSLLAAAAGPAHGLLAGQAWECEPDWELQRYHDAKTASLFEAAAVGGALAAGADGESWRSFGRQLGRFYQVVDDIADASGETARLGKSVGRDAALDRPSAVRAAGVPTALKRAHLLAESLVATIPSCQGREQLREVTNHILRSLLHNINDCAV